MRTPDSERRFLFSPLRVRPWASARFAGVVTAALASASAVAQPVGPTPEKSEWFSLVIGVLLIACVGLGAFMGSKRGHLD